MITINAKCIVEKKESSVGKDAVYKRKELTSGKLKKNLKEQIIESLIIMKLNGSVENIDHEKGRCQTIRGIRDVDLAKDGE